MERCTSDQLNTFSSVFFQISTHLEKTEEKVFNWSEVPLSEVTSYKIHTLVNKVKLNETIQCILPLYSQVAGLTISDHFSTLLSNLCLLKKFQSTLKLNSALDTWIYLSTMTWVSKFIKQKGKTDILGWSNSKGIPIFF